MLKLYEIDITCGNHNTRGVLLDLGPRTFLLRFSNCVVEGEFQDNTGICQDMKRLTFLKDGTGAAEFSKNVARALTWKTSALSPEARMEEIETLRPFPLWDICASPSQHESKADRKNRNPTLKEIVKRIDERFDFVEKHVRGIPALEQDLSDARKVPEHVALELFRRIQEFLTPEQQRIWVAVRDAHGVQKEALNKLKADGVVNSEATLSRRVAVIDKKLKEHGLPPCNASGPTERYVKSGGYTDRSGNTAPEELSPVETDWDKDPIERERTIRNYLALNSHEDRAYYHQYYPGIEDEAKKYKRHPK